MFYLYLILILSYFTDLQIESFIIASNNHQVNTQKCIYNNFYCNKLKSGNRIFLNSTTDNFAEDSYYNSAHYKSLIKYFNSPRELEEDSEYSSLKDKYVYKLKGTDKYFPSTYTIESLVAVPELFQENFLRRGEDHWKVLIEIRSKYKSKRLISDQIKHLEFEKVEASKRYYSTKNEQLREENIDLRNEIRGLNHKLDIIGEELNNLKNRLPNLLSPEVGSDSVIIKETLGDLSSKATIPHYEILERLSRGYIERGVSISGKGFSAYSGEVSRLSRALVNFMLDTLTRIFNYKEVTVPLVVSESTLKSTGHLPRFEDHLFKIDSRNLFNGEVGYLIPTSEVPLIALHKNCKFKHLPVWVTSYSECFRSEIQDYGVETRGLIRQHQFGKVELVCFADSSDLSEGVDYDLNNETESSSEPSNNTAGSDYVHTLMLSHIEFLLNLLQLPHRQVLLSSEDTSSTSFKTVDFEVYMPSLGHFIEVSSCSNTRDYQTSNLNIRTRSGKKIHSINGSGLAIGRTLSALLENNCVIRDNGLIQINIPEALRPYLNNDSVIYERP